MKFKKSIILLFVSIFIIGINYSCEKQEDKSIDKILEGEVSYSPKEVGNYWIYDIIAMDNNGNYTYLGIDSTYIIGTTEINENTYYEYRSASNSNFTQYLRDSAAYLVDEKGERFFYHKNDADTIEDNIVITSGDTISHTYRIIYHLKDDVKCSAGSFPAIEARNIRQLPLINRSDIGYDFYTIDIGIILRISMPDNNGNRVAYSLVRWGKAD
ncbi:MAG: hypothetical protein DRI86_07660 [Bacteroidetes bacterium]|nr:MAG: hypothetical protein DRI86_07660 [Bacteroidota bacterium]